MVNRCAGCWMRLISSSAIKSFTFLLFALHPSFHNYFIINVENKTPYRHLLVNVYDFFFHFMALSVNDNGG